MFTTRRYCSNRFRAISPTLQVLGKDDSIKDGCRLRLHDHPLWLQAAHLRDTLDAAHHQARRKDHGGLHCLRRSPAPPVGCGGFRASDDDERALGYANYRAARRDGVVRDWRDQGERSGVGATRAYHECCVRFARSPGFYGEQHHSIAVCRSEPQLFRAWRLLHERERQPILGSGAAGKYYREGPRQVTPLLPSKS